MRANRTYGSEGGEAKAFPTPIEERERRSQRTASLQPALATLMG